MIDSVPAIEGSPDGMDSYATTPYTYISAEEIRAVEEWADEDPEGPGGYTEAELEILLEYYFGKNL